MIRPASSTIETTLESQTELEMEDILVKEKDSSWQSVLFLSLRMKYSRLDLGMKVADSGSKYTGSGPSTAFRSLLEKCTTSDLESFLF